jgi:transposase-like protein
LSNFSDSFQNFENFANCKLKPFNAEDNKTDEKKKISELEKKVKQFEMENDILKQAALLLGKR